MPDGADNGGVQKAIDKIRDALIDGSEPIVTEEAEPTAQGEAVVNITGNGNTIIIFGARLPKL